MDYKLIIPIAVKMKIIVPITISMVDKIIAPVKAIKALARLSGSLRNSSRGSLLIKSPY